VETLRRSDRPRSEWPRRRTTPSHSRGGGTGKSRLAIQAAWLLYLEEKCDMAFLVPAETPSDLDTKIAELDSSSFLNLYWDAEPPKELETRKKRSSRRCTRRQAAGFCSWITLIRRKRAMRRSGSLAIAGPSKSPKMAYCEREVHPESHSPSSLDLPHSIAQLQSIRRQRQIEQSLDSGFEFSVFRFRLPVLPVMKPDAFDFSG
jgi:hypothetical protein